MNYRHPELQQRLAGEYVVGTLHGAARRRFEKLLVSDRGLQQIVQAWERRLAPLLQHAPEVEVPAHVWSSIQQRLGHSPATHSSAAQQHADVAFWRWLGLASSGVATAMLLLLLFYPAPAPVLVPPTSPAALVDIAVLSTDKAEPVWIVRRRGDDRLEFSGLVNTALPQDRDFELWSIPDGGAPLSLGVVHLKGGSAAELVLTSAARERLAQGALLAISLEPAGGSPTGAPTGPVLYSGKLAG
ncbi:MAG: anti-sigma factor [Moraxellaceae bacterium]|nr:anti-sigma factor [Moraxellaceae bacterium]